jgi:molybdopterin molybdotransferase
MTSYEGALAAILREVSLLESERIPLADLRNRVLSEQVLAPLDLPPFDNSAVDGYAVRTPAASPLTVAGEIAAGASSAGIEVGERMAYRIFTGAPLPAGADAVVMQEDVSREGGQIILDSLPKTGDHIRRRGEELVVGDLVLPKNLVATPAVVGVLATLGLPAATVYRRPRVAIVETGNELTEPGLPLTPGSVYAANGVALAAGAEALGAATTVRRAGDDREVLRQTFAQALEYADVVVTSGGVSVGDHDLVRPTWDALGVIERFWRVAIKPGKPVFFGRVEGGPLVFGLPGNPVSSLVTFHLFVRPVLLAMQGLRDPSPLEFVAGADMRGSEHRDEFVRATLQDGVATPLERQGSHMASGLALANGLVRLPAGATHVPRGSSVTGLRLDWTLTTAQSCDAP